MVVFFVDNLSDKPLELAIEPWADLEILAPDARAEFEYEEPAELSFAIMQDGSAVVSIVSEYIKVSANGGEKTFGCTVEVGQSMPTPLTK
jgi:hypothetical protein